MLYLHLSGYEGKTLLAVVSEEPFVRDGHHKVVDVEIVESRGEAHDWYLRQIKEHGGAHHDEEDDTLHRREVEQKDNNIMWT